MLCDACEEIISPARLGRPSVRFKQWWLSQTHRRPDMFAPHHSSMANLKRASETGCLICHTIHLKTAQLESSVPTTGAYYQMGVQWGWLWIKLLDSEGIRSFGFRMQTDTQDTGINRIAQITDYTGSTQTWKCIARWLDQCVQHHHCEEEERYDWHPTRLLDLRTFAESSSIRLVEDHEHFSSDNQGRRYVTLSHCWGQNMPIKLTRARLGEFKHAIAFNDLPLTFQHAIEATLLLDIRYLWIDSLCIIQDDDADWAIESKRMSQVYGRSFCTLAAAHALDSSGGLFRRRQPGWILPHATYLGLLDPQSFEDRCDPWSVGVEDSNLAGRAWAYQERMLSPRLLIFAQDQVFWECSKSCACEAYPDGIVNDNYMNITPLPKVHKLKHYVSDKHSEYLYNCLNTCCVWRRIVSQYSRGRLTFRSDKLVAIAGIAQQFRCLLKGDFVAGLQTENFVADMLWRRDDPPTKRPRNTSAPSYSWASVDGEVSWYNDCIYDLKPLLTVVDFDIRTAPGTQDEPTSAYAGPIIRLQGCLKSYQLSTSQANAPRRIRINGQEHPISLHDLLYDEPEEGYTEATRLFYVAAGFDNYPHRTGFHYHLLLRHVGDTIYQRMGLLYSPFEPNSLLTVLNAPQDDEAELPCETYDPATHTHTFCLA